METTLMAASWTLLKKMVCFLSIFTPIAWGLLCVVEASLTLCAKASRTHNWHRLVRKLKNGLSITLNNLKRCEIKSVYLFQLRKDRCFSFQFHSHLVDDIHASKKDTGISQHHVFYWVISIVVSFCFVLDEHHSQQQRVRFLRMLSLHHHLKGQSQHSPQC